MTPEEYGLEVAKAAAGGFARESVNKLYNAIGNIFPFFGTKREAVTTYIDEIEKCDLPPATKAFAIANAKKILKYVSRQMSIAQIAQQVAKEGTDFSEHSSVNEEWLERFMDSAKYVSDEEVQILWGHILAKEFEEPNSTPPSVIRILTELTPQYAKAFATICSHSLSVEVSDEADNIFASESQVIVPFKYDYLKESGLDFTTINELQMLGLIQFDGSGSYILDFNNLQYPKLNLRYGHKTVIITEYEDYMLPTRSLRLTEAGKSISRFVEQTYIPGYFEAICDYLECQGLEILRDWDTVG